MPRSSQPDRRGDQPGLSFLDTARRFYGEAFGSRDPRTVEASRDDWAELEQEDRSFAIAHLLYLDLMAQAASTRLLVQVRDLLEEIADALPEEPEEADDDEQDDDEDEPYEDGEPADDLEQALAPDEPDELEDDDDEPAESEEDEPEGTDDEGAEPGAGEE